MANARVIADGGFAKLDDIDTLAENDVEVFVPVPKPRDAGRDRHVPLRNDTPAVGAWRQRMGESGGRLRRDSVSVPLSGSSAGWVHSVPLPGPHAGRALARPE